MAEKRTLLFCATDKEVFDAYMSAPQHFNENALVDIGVSRGIFYSWRDDRETLSENLSSLILSFSDLRLIENYFEKAGRADRRSAIVLDVDLSQEQLKDIAKRMIADAKEDEVMVSVPVGDSGLLLTTKYSELDHGSTRLKQRREREAAISFTKENGKIVVRLPATERANGITTAFVDKLEQNLKKSVEREEIDLSAFDNPDTRTLFFTSLITGLPDSQLDNVLRVRVERNPAVSSGFNEDEEDREEAKEELLSVVRNVALNGESLLASPEYQSLKKRGFYITSVTWRVRMKPPSGPIVEFEAGFDQPAECRGFRYAVRQWKTQYGSGEDRKTFSPLPDMSKDEYGKMIEVTAADILCRLIKGKSKTQDESAKAGNQK